MKIKYFGTAAAEGWPGMFCNCVCCKSARELGGKNLRTRSQALVNDTLLIDFPPDTYMHVQSGLDLPNIHELIITHSHQDHFHLPDLALRCEWFANDINGSLTVYGNDKVKRMYDEYLGTERYHHLLDGKLECREIAPFEPALIGGHSVTPLLANHDKSEKCYIYLIERDGQSLLYGNDTGYFLDETWEYIAGRGIDIVSLDCTSLKFKEGTNHMGIPDVIEVRERMIDSGAASGNAVFIVNHFSHNGKLLHHEIEACVDKHGFIVTYDGMELTI